MLDECSALRAWFVCDVDRTATGSFDARKKDRVVFCVKRETRIEVVIYPRRSVVVRKKPTRAATVNTVHFTRRYTIVSFTDDLSFPVDQNGAYLAPRTRTELSQPGCLKQPVLVHLVLIRQRLANRSSDHS